MAITPQGQSGTLDEVETTFRSRKSAIRPNETLAWQSVGAQTGSFASGGAAAASIFSLSNRGNNLLLVRRIGVGFITLTALTVPQVVDLEAIVARSFTAADTSGNAIAVVGSNIKHRTSLPTQQAIDCRISAGNVLTAGTKTMDANSLGQTGGYTNGIGTGFPLALDNLLAHNPGDYPVVLTPNEGINIRLLTTIATTGSIRFYVAVEFAEAVSY